MELPVDFFQNWKFLGLFFLNFYVSILLELGLSLAQFCLPAYIKLQSIYLDLGIKLPGWTFPCLAV